MKNIFSIILTAFLILILEQQSISQNKIECGTPDPEKAIPIPLHYQRSAGASNPVMLRVIVHIIANDNGSVRAASDTSVLRQLENMQLFFAPHNICFQLLGLRQINNTALNYFNVNTSEEELDPYKLSNSINIFVHASLYSNSQDLNGYSYGIPNTFMSISGEAIQSSSNRSTMAHEMGHLLGLLHTFRGQELVDRTGNCSNCDEEGDLICDTPADPHSSSYDTGDYIDVDCNYLDDIVDECQNTYQMDPSNIMAYGRRACRDQFTTGQAERMHYFLDTDPDLISRIVSTSNITLSPGANTTVTSGWVVYSALNTITVQGNTYTITNDAKGHFAGERIIIKPKVVFSPGANGYVQVIPDVLCD